GKAPVFEKLPEMFVQDDTDLYGGNGGDGGIHRSDMQAQQVWHVSWKVESDDLALAVSRHFERTGKPLHQEACLQVPVSLTNDVAVSIERDHTDRQSCQRISLAFREIDNILHL